jgi:hypothetical protein
MRLKRLFFILTAFYLTFIGGAAYYTLVLPVRLFHHAFVTLVLAIWLINRLRKAQGLPLTPLNRPIYAAVIVWFITALTSLDPRVALENLWLPLTHVGFYFILADMSKMGHGNRFYPGRGRCAYHRARSGVLVFRTGHSARDSDWMVQRVPHPPDTAARGTGDEHQHAACRICRAAGHAVCGLGAYCAAA